jgi:hypothetical protein
MITRKVTKNNIAFIRQILPYIKLGEFVLIDPSNNYMNEGTEE